MENLIREIKSRLNTLNEALEHAGITGYFYPDAYRLAKKEKKVLVKMLKKLDKIENARAKAWDFIS